MAVAAIPKRPAAEEREVVTAAGTAVAEREVATEVAETEAGWR